MALVFGSGSFLDAGLLRWRLYGEWECGVAVDLGWIKSGVRWSLLRMGGTKWPWDTRWEYRLFEYVTSSNWVECRITYVIWLVGRKMQWIMAMQEIVSLTSLRYARIGFRHVGFLFFKLYFLSALIYRIQRIM